MEFGVAVVRRNDWAVVVLRGEVDLATAPILRRKMAQLADGGSLHVCLDMGEVDFIDSAGLGVLVAAYKRVREHGGDLRLACVQRNIVRLLQISGLDKVLSVHGSVDEACAHPGDTGDIDLR